MLDLGRAQDFVRDHGSEVDRARLDYLLGGTPPAEVTTAALFSGQRPDGAWSPFWAPHAGSLDATCYRIAQAHALGLDCGVAVLRALQFLRARQGEDGSWE